MSEKLPEGVVSLEDFKKRKQKENPDKIYTELDILIMYRDLYAQLVPQLAQYLNFANNVVNGLNREITIRQSMGGKPTNPEPPDHAS